MARDDKARGGGLRGAADRLLEDEFASESLGISNDQADDWLQQVEGQLAVDVYQTKTEVVIKAPIAGVKPDEISIAITDDVVTIKGERREAQEVERENYYAQECYWGAFARSVILPVTTLSDKAEATFQDGVLTIRIPKAETAKTKIVRVKPLSTPE